MSSTESNKVPLHLLAAALLVAMIAFTMYLGVGGGSPTIGKVAGGSIDRHTVEEQTTEEEFIIQYFLLDLGGMALGTLNRSRQDANPAQPISTPRHSQPLPQSTAEQKKSISDIFENATQGKTSTTTKQNPPKIEKTNPVPIKNLSKSKSSTPTKYSDVQKKSSKGEYLTKEKYTEDK